MIEHFWQLVVGIWLGLGAVVVALAPVVALAWWFDRRSR